MKRRAWKWMALTVSGGLLLQLGACLPVLFDLLFQQVTSLVVSSVVSGILQGTPTQ